MLGLTLRLREYLEVMPILALEVSCPSAHSLMRSGRSTTPSGRTNGSANTRRRRSTRGRLGPTLTDCRPSSRHAISW